MNNHFSEKTKQKQILCVGLWILQIIVFLILAYVVFLRFKTEQHIAMPVIGCVLLVIIGISRIVLARNRYQGDEGEKQFNKIVWRSVILAPIIVTVFIVIVVLIKLQMD